MVYNVYIYIYVHTHIYIYIYTYIDIQLVDGIISLDKPPNMEDMEDIDFGISTC